MQFLQTHGNLNCKTHHCLSVRSDLDCARVLCRITSVNDIGIMRVAKLSIKNGNLF